MKIIIILVLVILGLVFGGVYLYKHFQKERTQPNTPVSGEPYKIDEYWKNDKEEIEKLLSENKQVDFKKFLEAAIMTRNKEFLDFLIEKGAKTDSLPVAIALGKKEEVENYLKQDKTIHARVYGKFVEGGSSVSALYIAVVYNQVEVAKLLLKYGADIESGFGYMYFGESGGPRFKDTPPLMTAVEEDYKEMAQLLLENGASINYENEYGKTVLDIARQHQNKEIEELLLKYGAKEGSHYKVDPSLID